MNSSVVNIYLSIDTSEAVKHTHTHIYTREITGTKIAICFSMTLQQFRTVSRNSLFFLSFFARIRQAPKRQISSTFSTNSAQKCGFVVESCTSQLFCMTMGRISNHNNHAIKFSYYKF